jgi:hypothetical protein
MPVDNDSRADAQVFKCKRREIAATYAADKRDKLRNKRKPALAALMFADAERFWSDFYGRKFTNDDSGRNDFWIGVNLLAGCPNAHDRCWKFLRRWAPWIPESEAERKIARALKKPHWFTADTLARKLGLTFAKRTALGITTIGSIDVDKAGRLELRKQKDRDRKRAKRAAAKAERPARLTKAKPWEAEGICRRTWERRRKRGVAKPVRSIPYGSYGGDAICDTEERQGYAPLPKGDGARLPHSKEGGRIATEDLRWHSKENLQRASERSEAARARARNYRQELKLA